MKVALGALYKGVKSAVDLLGPEPRVGSWILYVISEESQKVK